MLVKDLITILSKCDKEQPVCLETESGDIQTLEDGFTANGIDQKTGKVVPISNTQRYKALGNGWTVDVIAHILKSLDFSE